LYYPTDEVGDAYLYCSGLAGLLATRGVEFQYDTAVGGFERRGGRLHAALTAAAPVAGDAFVLACGSGSAALAATLGLKLPIRPAKGYSITLPRRIGDGGPQIPIIDHAMHVAITPLGGERLRVVGTAELAGYDRSIRPARIQNLLRVLERTLPRFAAQIDRSDVKPWAGLRPMSADGVPVLGATSVENLYLNTGHGHLGWTLAAASGRMVADALVGRPAPLSLGDYQLDRFQRSSAP
jgi:D-amino-acid dehydrogenase